MRNYHMRARHYHMPTINVDHIWNLVSEKTRRAWKAKVDAATTDEEKAKVKAPVFNMNKAVSILGKFC